MGIHKIDSSNKNLDSAMEVDGEEATAVNNITDKRVDNMISKANAKEKQERQKNLRRTEKTNCRGPQKLFGMVQEMRTTLGSVRALPQRRNYRRDQKKRGEGRQNKTPRATTMNGTKTTRLPGKAAARADHATNTRKASPAPS